MSYSSQSSLGVVTGDAVGSFIDNMMACDGNNIITYLMPQIQRINAQ
jgi:hypothetical protein